MNKNLIDTITPAELRELLKISRSTYYRMLARGELPQPIEVSERVKIFNLADIEKLLGLKLVA
jgi:predicted DNA-binding transcriptional regulator AlpA|tara:strand:- start:885 stop:1073 length:189 start_codon:yes stop_codon:yes gene_type:complete